MYFMNGSSCCFAQTSSFDVTQQTTRLTEGLLFFSAIQSSRKVSFTNEYLLSYIPSGIFFTRFAFPKPFSFLKCSLCFFTNLISAIIPIFRDSGRPGDLVGHFFDFPLVATKTSFFEAFLVVTNCTN